LAILLDTHAWVWAVDDAPRLSARAVQEIEMADAVHLSAISLYEICQKVRLGKWPEMAGHVDNLQGLLTQQSIVLSAIDTDIAVCAGLLDWQHRDPFDRIIAATAQVSGMTLISADTAFDKVPGLRRVWD
jgi:PIN domain nuclease of toxin-antitoxin system